MTGVSVAAVLDEMSAHRAGLRTLLDGFEPATLARRPADGRWSAVENVRHLLFAEQGHLGRFVEGGLGLSPMGMVQGGLQGNPRVAIVGTAPTTDLRAVFDEWERVHAAALVGLDLAQSRLAVVLPRLLRHQQTHGTLAARAARKSAAESASRHGE